MKLSLLALAFICMAVHPKNYSQMVYELKGDSQSSIYTGKITIDGAIVFNVAIDYKYIKMFKGERVTLNPDGLYSDGKKIPFLKFEREIIFIIIKKKYDWRNPFN